MGWKEGWTMMAFQIPPSLATHVLAEQRKTGRSKAEVGRFALMERYGVTDLELEHPINAPVAKDSEAIAK